MLNTVQNTWQGQNNFPHAGNQFWGQFNGTFNGVFNGSGSGLTNINPININPGTFQPGAFFGSPAASPLPMTTFGSAAKPITFNGFFNGTLGTSGSPVVGYAGTSGSPLTGYFYGAFSGNGTGLTSLSSSALTGALPAISGAALTGIPTLGANQTWTGDNTWTSAGNNFTPGPLLMGNSSVTVPAFLGYGFAGVTGQFSAYGTLYTCSSGYAGSIPISGLFSETTCQLGHSGTADTDLSLYAYGYIYAKGNINTSGAFYGSPAGLTGYRSAYFNVASGDTSATVAFSSPVPNASYSVVFSPSVIVDTGTGVPTGSIYVASQGVDGFVATWTGGALDSGGIVYYVVWPWN